MSSQRKGHFSKFSRIRNNIPFYELHLGNLQMVAKLGFLRSKFLLFSWLKISSRGFRLFSTLGKRTSGWLTIKEVSTFALLCSTSITSLIFLTYTASAGGIPPKYRESIIFTKSYAPEKLQLALPILFSHQTYSSNSRKKPLRCPIYSQFINSSHKILHRLRHMEEQSRENKHVLNNL